MKFRVALAAILALAGTADAWGGVALESFGIEPSGPGPQLFNTVGSQSVPGADAGPGATVAWPVTVNTALLNTLPATVRSLPRQRLTE